MIITRGLGSNLVVTQGYGLEIVLVYPFCPGVSPYALTESPFIIGGVSQFGEVPSYVPAQNTFSEILGSYYAVDQFSEVIQYSAAAMGFISSDSPFTQNTQFSDEIEKCAGV